MGRGDEVLDAHGGTTVLQTSPARIALTGGTEQLACVKLAPGDQGPATLP